MSGKRVCTYELVADASGSPVLDAIATYEAVDVVT
jgi:hypothetical protein